MAGVTLYSYFRSSAAFRVRIALNLKGVAPEYRFVHLLNKGGEQHRAAYHAVNPQELVPSITHDGHTFGQSLAIIEYLDEIFPEPPLLPNSPAARARVRQLAYVVACDIHPVNNLRVLRHLKNAYAFDDDQRTDWQVHWTSLGFSALEEMLVRSSDTGRFCHGDIPTLADICLIPQLANARRVGLDLTPFPTLIRIESESMTLSAFFNARPEAQSDAE